MKTIKPSQIKEILDLALKIRKNGGTYTPCFAGDAGIGKSEIVQQWAKAQGDDFTFIDLRLAYLESPDLIGLPEKVQINGVWRSIHSLPDFWPEHGQGLILFEEPNRAHESTMNAMMQILTDRKVHNYSVPEGFIMAAAINPEGNYTVNTMDPAMKNRFSMFDVVYDHNSFVNYIKSAGWSVSLVNFIDKYWIYKSVDEVQNGNSKYVSPRSWSKVNALMQAEADQSSLFAELLNADVGNEIGSDFLKFLREHRPVLVADLLADRVGALKKLKSISEGDTYSGDLLSLTVASVLEAFNSKQVDEELLIQVADVLTVDQAINLIIGAIKPLSAEEADDFIARNSKYIQEINRRQTGKIVVEKKDEK